MWDPYHAAFRAGYVNSTEWDPVNIGHYSVAMGFNTLASGTGSTAIGEDDTASGISSTALGASTRASGAEAAAMGWKSKASGGASTAMGYVATASGEASTAMGEFPTASGLYSTAMGDFTTASGVASTAMGNNTTASGHYSTAIGNNVSTNGDTGSCIIGDYSTYTTTNSSANNQMTMRFDNGYNLYSKADLSTGVYMEHGVSGWTNYSDRNKKQNFQPFDGEALLLKIRAIPITEWSYKGADPSIRYIGPMAQDFYAAFHLGGKDSLGINSISIDGVNMAAVQALEKRTAELQKATAKIAELEKQTSELQEAREKISALETSLNKLSAVVQTLVDEKNNVSMNVVERKEQ
jgi:Head domain of trimeric autotransporter adhesin/Chaperone of endosialidase